MRTTRSTTTPSIRPAGIAVSARPSARPSARTSARRRVAGVALVASAAVSASALGATFASATVDNERPCPAVETSPGTTTSSLDDAPSGCDTDALRARYNMPYAWPQKRAAVQPEAPAPSGEVFVKLPATGV